MISSKELMARSGLSRATLNNYIGLGLLSKPTIRSGEAGERLLGFFPDSSLDRIETIRKLKALGKSMPEIVRLLAEEELASEPGEVRDLPPAERGEMQVSLEDLDTPAYMFNYRLEVIWHNDAARRELFGDFARLPASSDERNLLALMMEGASDWKRELGDELLSTHLRLAGTRISRQGLLGTLRGLAPSRHDRIVRLLDTLPAAEEQRQPVLVMPVDLPQGKLAKHYQLVASYFREGVLVVLTPAEQADQNLLGYLAQRDVVIRQLLRRRLPVLTPLAVLVADLQGSTRICSELPPEEYFELINEIWSSMEPIYRKYFGTHGKHVGDGMLYYFFPQAESDYIVNALQCAIELRERMREINARWRLHKGWVNDLYLNIGLHEGTEWLGTFQSSTAVEFVVLGDTINQAARLSELSRFGSIYVTKSLLGRMSSQDRDRLTYGVARRGAEQQEIFIEKSFAQVDSLIDLNSHPKMRDVATLPVTELRGLRRI